MNSSLVNNMYAKMVHGLVALAVLCLVSLALSGNANAATAYRVSSPGTPGDFTSSQTSACQNWVGKNPGYAFQSLSLSSPYYFCVVKLNGGPNHNIEGGTLTTACPAGQGFNLPSATQPSCAVPPVNNCPTSGTSAGIQNITTAWANGTSATSKIQQKIVPDGGVSNAGSINYCVSSCGVSNSGAAPTACWQSSLPSNSGLYRISCDVPMVSTGQPCTAGTGAGQTPDPTVPPAAPACAGAFGTVNGKPTCLDASGATANNTNPAPVPGNPAPGTVGGGDKSTAVDPVTGAGTGTTGTGTGGAGGGSGGSGTNVTVEVKDIATCGLPGKPKCIMDESGTPENGDSVFTAAKDALTTAVTAHKDAIGQVTNDDGKDTSWGWFPSFPQGTCTPIQFGPLGEVNWCAIAPTIQLVMSFLWSLVTVIFVIGMTSSAIKGK